MKTFKPSIIAMDTAQKQALKIRCRLELAGVSASAVAEQMGLTPEHVRMSIRYPSKSQPVRKKIAEVLGTHPWKNYREQDGWGKDGKQKLISE